ncbi:MAG: LysR substrate-binding domain-containing protein [Burkholderiaceae bacterium]
MTASPALHGTHMKLQQLKHLNEVVEHGFNISKAAQHLHTSQPGISRLLSLLEDELGVHIFVRNSRRLIGLTPAGEAVYAIAKRMMSDAEDMKRIAKDFRTGKAGDLSIATSHSCARYTLPALIKTFATRFPRVRLRLRQGSASQAAEWLGSGMAHLSVTSAPAEEVADVSYIRCHELHRVILVPNGHSLTRKRRITLEDVAQFPIVTYDEGFSGRAQIVQAFQRQRLTPNIVLGATDADTMKTYARLGIGICIVAHIAYDKRVDHGLRAIDATSLFGSSYIYAGIKRTSYLSEHIVHFVKLLAPQLSENEIRAAAVGRKAHHAIA